MKDQPQEKVVAYRGHSDHTFKLQPRVFRHKKSKQHEERILSELLTESPDDFKDDRTVFEQLVRAQHYDLPTRLLDVTLNPLVALYFATRESIHSGNDGEVIQFIISPERAKLFDSDTVSCISNVARLSYDEKNELFKFLNAASGKGGISALDINDFNKRDDVKRLVQFIRVEKPYFQNTVRPIDLRRFIFVTPKRNNKRVLAQSGAFIIAGLLRSVGDESSRALEINRIRINSQHKDEILRDLDKLNINERTMFPEVENAARYITKKITS
ncbi:FRG domain-containing protein [Rhodovulum strictum]|uniref:FRG domain-containing protein n=1 Tax=Rhodovulum strictum TaxID=58314 RepID=UPI00129BF6F9|nr:FRG domain-containing protein [Rhodovulum strictum]